MQQINLFEPAETKEIYLASFCLDRKELLNGLRSIKRSMQVAYRDSFLLQFELFVLENSIHLRLFENEYWIETPTSGTCRTTLYYRDVMDAIRACKEHYVEITIREKQIGIQKIRLNASTEKLPANSKEIPLSTLFPPRKSNNPFMEIDLQYTPNSNDSLSYPKSIVDKDVRFVKEILRKYNIAPKDIEAFIHSHLKFSVK